MFELVKRDLALSLRYMKQMNGLFHYDTMRAVALATEKQQEFNRGEASYEEYMFWLRGLIRTSFAHIEGVTYLMRQMTIWAWERSEIILTEDEAAKLMEEELIERDGEKIKKKRFNQLRENFELAFKYFPMAFGASFRLNKGDTGWPSFLNAAKTRNAVTHPKKPSEFMLSGIAVKEIKDTMTWFSETMSKLLAECEKAAKKSA